MLQKFKIYAGLGGGFGGATYRGTWEYEKQEYAYQDAYEMATEEYNNYAGFHGLLSWEDIAEENPDWDEDEIDEEYAEQMESWLDYYVEPAE